MGTLATPQPTKRALPTGGVQIPIQRLKHITIPKWTGWSPSLMATGRKIGVKIKMAGVKSIKVPMTRRIILRMSKTIIGETESEFIRLAIISGILALAIAQDMLMLLPTRKSTIAVVLTDPRKIFGSCDQLISL